MKSLEKRDEQQGRGTAWLPLALGAVAAAGGWIGYSATMIDHNLPLPLALNAERHLFTGRIAGLLNYYVDDSAEGRPLVLVHSINAGASSYEMRPLFEHYRGQRPVYALDLPGFGFSERSDRHYSAAMYGAAVRDLLEQIVEVPADVIALSLGSEFAARAALEAPGLFHSLTLISPTGLGKDKGNGGDGSAGNTTFYQILATPLWSQAIYDLLVTRPSLHYFLQKSFHGPVDAGLESYSYLTTHQPGARFAPLYFVSGQLFTPQVRRQIYAKVEVPALVIYDEDAYTSFTEMPDLLLDHPNWSAVRITPTRGLPHFEQPETTTRVLDHFWEGISAA
ncbi:MAG: alpha/beta hydrolase [Anaerolineae bacterium]|nr:alpha/beta hydrolase [Anaerolineae bacterium]